MAVGSKIRPKGYRGPEKGLRLQKIIATAGLASRREAEEWILAGRVMVNGKVVTQLGTCAHPLEDSIRADGRVIRVLSEHAYYLFHKPIGVITAMKEEEGRRTVESFLGATHKRQGIFNVGRLDYNSAGLLLLTNDGELAFRLTHPRFKVKRVYSVKIGGILTDGELMRLQRGVRLGDGIALPTEVRLIRKLRHKSWLECGLYRGRYREVRRMFNTIGHSVEKLVRIRFGPISLGRLGSGEIRQLLNREVAMLYRTVGLSHNR